MKLHIKRIIYFQDGDIFPTYMLLEGSCSFLKYRNDYDNMLEDRDQHGLGGYMYSCAYTRFFR